MERTLAAVLAAVAVLAVALPGPAAVASRPPAASEAPDAAPVAMPNTTAKLVLPGGGHPGAGVAAADLGAALALDRRAAVTHMGMVDLERRFEAATDDDARAAVVRRGLDAVENRTRELRAVEARAYRQYASGNRSLRSLLLTLAHVDAAARQYRTRISRLADLAARVPDVTLRQGNRLVGRASGVDAQLETLTGPVRRHVARSLAGTDDAGLVYAAAADQGVVLAAVVDGTYVREALRADRIESGPGHPIDVTEIVETSYPWTWDHQVVNRVAIFIPPIGVWRLDMGHTQGQLVAYVDRGSESVYREVQWLHPERLPTAGPATGENDGLEVTVDRTFPGGPVKVRVVDNTTRLPVGSVVTVGSHHLGRTGPDGELWTVAPPGAFTVAVRQGPNTVNVSVPAAEFRTTE